MFIFFNRFLHFYGNFAVSLRPISRLSHGTLMVVNPAFDSVEIHILHPFFSQNMVDPHINIQ